MPTRLAPEMEQVDAGDLVIGQRKQGQRLLVAGSRRWDDYELIFRTIKAYDDTRRIDYLIEGNNGYDSEGRSLDQYDDNETDFVAVRGADRLAGKAAQILYIPVLRFIPDWNNWGRAAGMVRNKQMILNGEPTNAVLFHDDILSSAGTRNMMRLLGEHGIAYEIVHH